MHNDMKHLIFDNCNVHNYFVLQSMINVAANVLFLSCLNHCFFNVHKYKQLQIFMCVKCIKENILLNWNIFIFGLSIYLYF